MWHLLNVAQMYVQWSKVANGKRYIQVRFGVNYSYFPQIIPQIPQMIPKFPKSNNCLLFFRFKMTNNKNSLNPANYIRHSPQKNGYQKLSRLILTENMTIPAVPAKTFSYDFHLLLGETTQVGAKHYHYLHNYA